MKKVALLIPSEYHSNIHYAIKLANTLINGATYSHDSLELVFAYEEHLENISNDIFVDLNKSIKRRAYKWIHLDKKTALRAMHYAGYSNWTPQHAKYSVPDDDINHFFDCDLWLVASQKGLTPFLPIKPYKCILPQLKHMEEHFLEIDASKEKEYWEEIKQCL